MFYPRSMQTDVPGLVLCRRGPGQPASLCSRRVRQKPRVAASEDTGGKHAAVLHGRRGFESARFVLCWRSQSFHQSESGGGVQSPARKLGAMRRRDSPEGRARYSVRAAAWPWANGAQRTDATYMATLRDFEIGEAFHENKTRWVQGLPSPKSPEGVQIRPASARSASRFRRALILM